MEMHDILATIQVDEQPCVLATIVCVEGHSYRKAGASMLFKLNGEQVGTISPGCLESDLFERAEQLWSSGTFELVSYNMNADEDVIWGEAVGCGGKLQLLLEPVRGVLRSMLLEAYELERAGGAVWLKRSWTGEQIDYELRIDDSGTVNRGLAQLRCDAENTLSILITNRPRLVLFGSGKDVKALYTIALGIGFRVIVADWRPALCHADLFPGAECVTGSPEQIMEQLQLNAEDYLIVSSHNLHQDREMIRLALPLQLVYVGVMGSKKRIRLLFETFLIPSNVHAPVGLSIGADGPQEIAISVAAELIAIRAERRAESRRGTIRDAHFSSIFSGRYEQQDGAAQASDRTRDIRITRSYSSTCSSG